MPRLTIVADKAADVGEIVRVSNSEGVCREWVPSDQFLDNVASSDVSDHPDRCGA